MTARRLNRVLAVILAAMTVFAFLSAGAAAWMWRNPGAVMAVRQAVEIYPAPLRRAIRADLAANRGEMKEDVARIDAARRRMLELMRAEPLDEKAIRGAMKDVRDAVAAVQAVGQEHLLDVMRKADPADRSRIRVPKEDLSERLQSFRD